MEREARETLGATIEFAMRARRRVVLHLRQIVDAYFAPTFGPLRGPKPVLKPSGSFALGICDGSSDVDLVCVFPSEANWTTFQGLARHLQSMTTGSDVSTTAATAATTATSTTTTAMSPTTMKKRLRSKTPFEIRHVTYIAQAAVPLISFDFLLHNSPASSVGSNKTSTEVKVDLLFVRLPIPGPLPSSDLLPLDDDAVLVGMDSASVKGLNGVRSASMILSMVDCPNTRVYLDALRIVR